MEDDKKILSTEEANNDIENSNAASRLDALLFDADEDMPGQNEDDDTDFDSFMAEYRNLISRNLTEAAKEIKPDPEDEELDEEEARKEYEEEYLNPLPKKQPKNQQKKQQKKEAKKSEPEEGEELDSDWDEDITLEPEEYSDLTDDDELMMDEIPEDITPDFDLGEQDDENKFQLSISFNESNKVEPPSVLPEDKPYRFDPENPRGIDWAFDIAEIFVFVLAIVMILTCFVFKHSVVEGASMNNTLEDGDHLIISDLFYYPERGDIIVFEDYSTILKKAVVKRVIGLPGETVEIKVDREGIVRVYIDGDLLPEEYAYNAKDCDISTYHAPITLGENEIFVMGDNRYHSTDSRHIGVGPIDIDSVLGKVLFRFFPLDKFGAVD